jgi:acetyl esterase/lipase
MTQIVATVYAQTTGAGMKSEKALSLLISLLLIPMLLGTCLGEEFTSKFEVIVQSDIVFAEVDGVKLLVDLHLPKGAENPPLVMFIHGGGWSNGDRKRCKLAWTAQSGYAIASVEYRLSHEALFPAQIHDCKGALRWLRAHQTDYGIDAERVVVAGTSAGGHLAALMGTSGGVIELEGTTAGNADQSSLVQGVIDYYGPTDFILRSKNQPSKTEDAAGNVYKLLGGPVSKKQDLAHLASPVYHVRVGDPPLLIVHGENDKTVNLSQSNRLMTTYQDNKLDVQLHIELGKGHGWKSPSGIERELVLQFLKRCLRRD